MVKHYYVADDLDDLEQVEQELESIGIKESQIHVLSESAADVENHHLHTVNSFFQQDVVHSAEVGAIVGVVGALFILALSHFMGWTQSAAGWLPFVFLSLVVLGFSTWEGGLIGIQKPNINYAPFQKLLHEGKHILLVDSNNQQESAVNNVIGSHPHIRHAGVSASRWGVKLE
ncbi:MAG: NAD/FAD-utilizing enzyme [Piscirickettsiaceae bacterium]|jgi:hypothetical protein|nr:NAD/FAD-utilizing enzyme [Piscirickettsiaceae bacterium]